MKPRVILAGGSGFLGTRLAEDLARRGYEPLVLTRSTRLHTGLVRQRHWDGRTVADWAEELNHAFAMINLAGRSVNCRYTSTNRREIQQSRIEPTLALGQALQRCSHPPKVWVQASSLAIYGDAGDHWCDETTEPGEGFPVETCLRWEEAFNSVATPRTRALSCESASLSTRGAARSRLSKAWSAGFWAVPPVRAGNILAGSTGATSTRCSAGQSNGTTLRAPSMRLHLLRYQTPSLCAKCAFACTGRGVHPPRIGWLISEPG